MNKWLMLGIFIVLVVLFIMILWSPIKALFLRFAFHMQQLFISIDQFR